LRLPLQAQGVSKLETLSSSWQIRHSTIWINGSSSSWQSLPSRFSVDEADPDDPEALSTVGGDGDDSEGRWAGLTETGLTSWSTMSTKWSLIGLIKTLRKSKIEIGKVKLWNELEEEEDGDGKGEKILPENWRIGKREEKMKSEWKLNWNSKQCALLLLG
jgi:hypothetical protein